MWYLTHCLCARGWNFTAPRRILQSVLVLLKLETKFILNVFALNNHWMVVRVNFHNGLRVLLPRICLFLRSLKMIRAGRYRNTCLWTHLCINLNCVPIPSSRSSWSSFIFYDLNLITRLMMRIQLIRVAVQVCTCVQLDTACLMVWINDTSDIWNIFSND